MALTGPNKFKRRWWRRWFSWHNRRTRSASVPVPLAQTDKPERPGHGFWRLVWSVGRVVIILLVLFGVVAGTWSLRRWILRSPHFAIRTIRISPTKHTTQDEIRARMAVSLGENLFSVDLEAVARDVKNDTWVAQARVRRELPSTIVVDVVEREPACVVSLGPLYLADATGQVFKRASIDEAAELPVVTGLPRDGYVDDRESTQALMREALAMLELWREPVIGPGGKVAPPRPAIGEINIEPASGVTLYTVAHGVGIRLGRGDAADIRLRLRHFDQVWQALTVSGERPRMILVDHQTQADRVTVRLASRAASK